MPVVPAAHVSRTDCNPQMHTSSCSGVGATSSSASSSSIVSLATPVADDEEASAVGLQHMQHVNDWQVRTAGFACLSNCCRTDDLGRSRSSCTDKQDVQACLKQGITAAQHGSPVKAAVLLQCTACCSKRRYRDAHGMMIRQKVAGCGLTFPRLERHDGLAP